MDSQQLTLPCPPKKFCSLICHLELFPENVVFFKCICLIIHLNSSTVMPLNPSKHFVPNQAKRKCSVQTCQLMIQQDKILTLTEKYPLDQLSSNLPPPTPALPCPPPPPCPRPTTLASTCNSIKVELPWHIQAAQNHKIRMQFLLHHTPLLSPLSSQVKLTK